MEGAQLSPQGITLPGNGKAGILFEISQIVEWTILAEAFLVRTIVNYHNGWGAKAILAEKVRLEDVRGSIALLFEAAKLYPTGPLTRGRLRRGLNGRHKLSAKYL